MPQEAFAPVKLKSSIHVKKVFETLNDDAVANNIYLQNDIGKYKSLQIVTCCFPYSTTSS
jgi:hypothetical protein